MTDPIEEKYERPDLMQAAMQAAVQAAVAEHHRQGRAVVTWRDGRVVWLGPGNELFYEDPQKEAGTAAQSVGVQP